MDLEIDIRHKERLESNMPCVFVGNHQSNFDILTHACCYRPRTVAIGKKELIWIPFFGILFYVTGNIMLDRKNHVKALEGLKEAQEALTKKNISIYIFPEGTRSRAATKLLPFKKGAFHMAIAAQVSIVPIVASSIDPLIDMKNKKIRAGTVHIEVLEPISTKGMTESDVDKLLQMTYQRMQVVLDQTRTTVG